MFNSTVKHNKHFLNGNNIMFVSSFVFHIKYKLKTFFYYSKAPLKSKGNITRPSTVLRHT